MDLGALAEKEYPGRFIILGRDVSGEFNVAVYGMTGRKERTKARKLVPDNYGNNRVYVAPIAQERNTSLHYIAMCTESGNVAIGDGKRIEKTGDGETEVSIAEDITYSTGLSPDRKTNFLEPIHKLTIALGQYDYKKDESSTPRIGGYIDQKHAALGIVRRAKDGSSVRSVFEIPLIPGEGRFISTYDGPNTRPTPPFMSQPIEVALHFSTAEGLAEAVYSALRPEFRIGVVALYSPISGPYIKRQLSTKNAAQELALVK